MKAVMFRPLRRNRFAFVLLGTAGALIGHLLWAGEAYVSLDALLDQATRTSPAIRARAWRLAAERHAAEALPRWYLPDLSVEAGYGLAAGRGTNQSGPLARLLGEWTLWDGGRSEAAGRRQRLRAELVRVQGRRDDMQTRLALTALYLRAARLEQLQLLGARQIASYQRLRRSLLPRERIGTATRSDVRGTVIKADTVRQASRSFARASELLRGKLTLLAGMADQSDVIAVPPLSALTAPPLPSEQPALTLKRHPDYQLAALSVRLIRLEREALEIDLYRPSMGVDVYAGYGPRRDALDANRPEVGAELRFRFPLYTSRDRTAQLEAQRGNLEAARWEAEQQKLTVRSHLLELYQTLRHDRTALSEHRRLEQQAADNLRLAYVEFARGQKAPADMHEAIDTLFALRRERIDIELRLLLTAHELAELTRIAEASHGDAELELNNRGDRDE